MDILELRTDLEAADEGVSFPFGEDCEIVIAMWGNKAHKKFLRDMWKKHGRKIEAGAINDAQSDELMAGQWKYIVKGWSGLMEDGKELPFSEETLLRLVKDKRLRAFFGKIEAISKEESNFRQANVDEMGNDSPSSLDG